METEFAKVTFANVDNSGTDLIFQIDISGMNHTGNGVSGSIKVLATYIKSDGTENERRTSITISSGGVG